MGGEMRKLSLISAAFLGLCVFSACGSGGIHSLASLAPPPPAPLGITSGPLPSGTTGADYAGATGFPLTASGGVAPYTWSWAAVASSSLPPGITLTNTTISGTPTAAGSYNVTVTVADSESPPVVKSADYVVSIDMPLEITSVSPPGGTVGTGYGPTALAYFRCVWTPVFGWHYACSPCDPTYAGSCPALKCPGLDLKPCLEIQQVPVGFSFMASGGTSPYTWTATGLPAGLSLNSSTGNLTGTPTTADSYSVSVTVADSESPPAQVTSTYIVHIDGASSQK